MTSHQESIARRMVARLSPGPDTETPSSPTDETTDESAAGDAAVPGGAELVLTFAHVVTAVAGQAWDVYQSLDAGVVARRQRAARTQDMPALQRETARLKELLLNRLQAEARTPPELPETGRARILDAAAEETLAEADRDGGPRPQAPGA